MFGRGFDIPMLLQYNYISNTHIQGHRYQIEANRFCSLIRSRDGRRHVCCSSFSASSLLCLSSAQGRKGDSYVSQSIRFSDATSNTRYSEQAFPRVEQYVATQEPTASTFLLGPGQGRNSHKPQIPSIQRRQAVCLNTEMKLHLCSSFRLIVSHGQRAIAPAASPAYYHFQVVVDRYSRYSTHTHVYPVST